MIDLLRDDIYYDSSTGGAVLDYDKAAVKRNDLIDKTGSSKQYSATYDDALKQIREMDNDLIYNVAKKSVYEQGYHYGRNG